MKNKFANSESIKVLIDKISELKNLIDSKKQDVLVAGNNISLEGNKVSVDFSENIEKNIYTTVDGTEYTVYPVVSRND